VIRTGVFVSGVLLLFLFAAQNANAQIDRFSYYGPQVQMDALNNVSLGCDASSLDYRFTPLHSGELSSVVIYLMGELAYESGAGRGAYGYASDADDPDGNPGGTLLIQVETDDGSNTHLPSGTVLGSSTVPAVWNAADTLDKQFAPRALSPEPGLISGNIYHIVFTNTDAVVCDKNQQMRPGNYFSIDGIYVFAPGAPQPAIPVNQFSALEIPEGGSQWVELSTSGSGDQGTSPLVGLKFIDGTTEGLGYYDVSSALVGMSPANEGAREDITPASDITVSSVSVRFAWIQGPGEMHVQFQDPSGGDLDDCYFYPGTDFPATSGTVVWKTCGFAQPYTMIGGSTYHVVFEVPTDTQFRVYTMENGGKTSVGFGTGTTFQQGIAEIKPGSSWEIFNNCSCWDWEMYFTSPASGG